MSERTLIILKPDCMEKGFHGAVFSRLSNAGFELTACKLVRLQADTLRSHYAHIADKPFYPGLESYMMSRPVIIAIVEGPDAVARVRKMVGPTDSAQALPGTIRGDMGIDKQMNVIHASDSAESAEEEIKRFFKPDEIMA